MAAHEEAEVKNSDSTKSTTPSRPKSFESPTHPKRVGTRSNTASPMWERNGTAAPPGGSRLRQVTLGDDSPDDGTAVPVFGDWDDSDPASAEGYSHIFNKVREEKHGGGGGGKSPRLNTDDSSYYGQRPEAKKGCGCFPWGKK
ncbi:RPM1-interacting protein 4 [Lactuca sativa]|uniref:RIN4 pathogenic type III effector avirulence factor Avr cleavage site domain-containing protein n=1 Tax=Lactuca sativa TaxID=4236 RepID=A0A9R1X4U8_LACSA|nr:RPM1-interacting protein 4 [Lactuca sativa]KAJ0198639.1 hypothetical protein LSAT_V11C600322090 [Lactuca sativa]